MIQAYACCNSNRFTVDSTVEEDSYQDILLLMQLLTNLLNDKIFNMNSIKPVGPDSCKSIDVVLYGLNIIIPMMTTNLLQFPSLCSQ